MVWGKIKVGVDSDYEFGSQRRADRRLTLAF